MIELARWLFETEATDGPFAAPGFLWLLLLVPLVAAVLAVAARRQRAVLRRVFRGAVADQVVPRSVRRRRTARDVLLLVALAAGIVALAGPRFDKRVQLVEARGVDLVLVVDLSRSMDAADVAPSRLEQVRREIYDLIQILEGDRVGVVTFAGGAYPRMPLTQDHEALRMIVSEMSTRDFQAQGSALDEALRIGTELLGRDTASPAGRAMLVFSDGEIHEPGLALEQAAAAREAGVRVFTMAVGAEAAPIPLGNGSWQQDRQGRRVLTTPNEGFLLELAQAGGGAFARSGPSDADVRGLYQDGVRRLLDAGVRGVRPRVRWRAAWWWPLSLAVGAGLIAAWLGEGRRTWGIAAAALLAVHLAAAPSAWAASLPEADAAYRAGRYDEAARMLTEVAQARPEDPTLWERLGAARYRAGDAEGAARAWEQQALLEGRRRQETLFNLGNAHARAGRYQTAVERYDEVLALGDHPGAAQNRAVVQGELERRRAEQPPPPPEDPGGDSEPQDDPSQADSQSDGGAPQPSDGSGEPKEPKEPSDGEDDEGEGDDPADDEQLPPSGGSPEGEAKQGDRSQSGDQPTQIDGGRKQAGDDQERLDDSEVGQVRPTDLEGDPEGQAPGPAEGGQPVALDPEAQAAQQAERLLDGVEEGRPRITIPGGSADKPW